MKLHCSGVGSGEQIHPCVYFLIGSTDEGGLLDVYVGEADGFKERIKNHDYKKEWWQDVVVFVSQDKSLTKTGVQYLESVYIKRLKEIGRCSLKNGNNPTLPTIPREDVSGLETFYENLAAIMPLLGYDIFIQTSRGVDKSVDTLPEFICKKNDDRIVAHAVLLQDGKMKVLAGSGAEPEDVESFKTHPYWKLKQALLGMGRLKKKGDQLIFTDDYIFDSSSAAAAVIKARPASGPLEWRSKNGKTLKEILDKQIHQLESTPPWSGTLFCRGCVPRKITHLFVLNPAVTIECSGVMHKNSHQNIHRRNSRRESRKSAMQELGTGVLDWERVERISDRYGLVKLFDKPGQAKQAIELRQLKEGSHGRLVALVM